MRNQKQVECQISHEQVPMSQAIPIHIISPTILGYIKKTNPDLPEEGYVSLKVINQVRKQYVQDVIAKEQGELTKLKEELSTNLNEHGLLSRDFYQDYKEQLGFGDRVADKVAVFGGSWPCSFRFVESSSLSLVNSPCSFAITS